MPSTLRRIPKRHAASGRIFLCSPASLNRAKSPRPSSLRHRLRRVSPPAASSPSMVAPRPASGFDSMTTSSDWQICAQTHARLGESIAWHAAEQCLYWIDFFGPIVHRQKKTQGPVESWIIASGATIGSLVFVTQDRLLLALDHGLHLFDPA